MTRYLLLLIIIPIFSLSAPLVEISHPKANSFLSSLKKNFPNKKINIVIYKSSSRKFISLNGKLLPLMRDEKKLVAALNENLKNVLKQKEMGKISFDSVKISPQNDGFSLSFAPCNYSEKEFIGKWVAFITGENHVLLSKKEGKISMPAGTCHRPIELQWKPKSKPKELNLIVALYDGKGKYVISKSNKEMEAEKR
ncbi:hypothetical protein H5T88_02200 [bacterium]|nr:hypothetical protein [bacterium]